MMSYNYLKRGNNFEKYLGVFLSSCLIFFAIVILSKLLLFESVIDTSPTDYQNVSRIFKSAIIQAFFSTLLSVALGIFAGIAVYRRNIVFVKNVLIFFSFLAMIVPTTVAAIGVLSIWGRKGLLREYFSDSFIIDFLPSPYGLFTVIIAHTLFNAPLMFKITLSVLNGIPSHHWKLAAVNAFKINHYFKWIEWPALRKVIPQVSGLIFLLCFTSFAIVLMLGGGPKVTTLELSIYTALKFSFDLPTASKLCVFQLIFCGLILLILGKFPLKNWTGSIINTNFYFRSDKKDYFVIIIDWIIILIFSFIVILPIIYLIAKLNFINGLMLFERDIFWSSLKNSLFLSIISALFTCVLSLIILNTKIRISNNLESLNSKILKSIIDFSISLYLLIPPIVLGTSYFLLFNKIINISENAFILVLISNILLSLPFSCRVLEGKLNEVLNSHDYLSSALNIKGWNKFKRLTFPKISREFGFALGLSAALSFGDLGVIALFGSENFQTLPWVLYQITNRYGGGESDLLAILILFISILLFFMFMSISKFISRCVSNA